jgi:hypothetical protein
MGRRNSDAEQGKQFAFDMDRRPGKEQTTRKRREEIA